MAEKCKSFFFCLIFILIHENKSIEREKCDALNGLFMEETKKLFLNY